MRALLLITLFSIKAIGVFSQSTVNYAFSHSTTASLTDMSTGATNILVPAVTATNYASAVHPIGFDFWLMGVRHAYFSVNSNGLMRLGKTVITNLQNNSMTSTTNLPFLSAFWDDLNSYTLSSTSKIRYKVTGAAPNRMLTVEWKDFIIKNNSTNGVQLSTWQVWLHETSGTFEFVYGRMIRALASSTVDASIGMSSANANNKMIYITNITSPAVATASATAQNLGNTVVAGNNINNLNSTLNGSRTKYTFTSWIPSAAPTNLTFSGVGTGEMTLNWAQTSTNELGFVIYRSDDGGLTYNFVSQTAANVTNSLQGALSPSTTYYWKVYAVTEGALSNSINGSATTTACVGAPLTNTFTYTGSNQTYTWTAIPAASWSLGHTPTACENVVINFNRTSGGNATLTINLNTSVAVNNLTLNGAYGGSGNKILQFATNAYSLTVLGNLNISSTGGTGATSSVEMLANNGSVVTVKGNSIIGQATDTKFSGIAGILGNDPDFYFKGNLTFNTNSYSTSYGSYYFDGGATQTLTNSSFSYNILFGNVDIGLVTPTTLTLAGAYAVDTYTNNGNLTVNSGSSLVLPFDAAFNQFTAGTGSIILEANATLRLGDYGGGQSGSNFPVDYSTISVDPASTVEYNYTGANLPVIYTDIIYGNLVLSNNSIKFINGDLFIYGNFTNGAQSTFGCDEGTYLYGSTMINNGYIEGVYADSEFGFYGNIPQTYSGTGSFGTSVVPFGSWGVDIYNSSNVTLDAPIYTERLNLFNGTFINSNNFRIGTASYGLIQRGGDFLSVAGSLDTYPVINSPNNLILRYDSSASNTNTGFEIPASTDAYNVYSENGNGVTLTSNLTVTNDLQLLQNTFNLGSSTLKIRNTITKTGGIMNGSAGTLEMAGTAAQTIADNSFISNNLKNLIISNTNNVTGVTLADTLDIYRSVNFGTGGRKLTTGGFLTFKSNAAETAWLGQMVATNSIVGDAAVERYIPIHNKAWQFLSVPATGQTIKQAWQEGALTANGNPVSGYGTQLTSNVAGAATQPTPGFDVYTAPGASIKIYNSLTGGYSPVTSTANPIANPKGYMVFVRGDRGATTLASPVTATIMRTKGTLYTPLNPPLTVSLSTTGFESVGNPYASAIDFRLLNVTGGVQADFFYLWDPKLTTGPFSPFGLGGFQTFSWNGSSFDVTPGGGSYSGSNGNIESGQAFFVNAPFSLGTVPFTEACKVSGSNDVNRLPVVSGKQLRTNLYIINGTNRILIDGNLIQYDRSYSNSIDIKDGVKLNNTGENLGLMRNGKVLSVERRTPIQRADTVFYKLGQLRVQQYELEFAATDLKQPGLTAWLEDNYLQTSTPVSLNGTSRYMFNVVNIPGAYAADRFRLVFRQVKQAVTVPVNAAEEMGKNPAAEVVVKLLTEQANKGIHIYPNPVVNKVMHLQFNGQADGDYNINLINKLGQPVYNTTIQLANNGSDVAKSITVPGIAAGVYQLSITTAEGSKVSLQVFIQ